MVAADLEAAWELGRLAFGGPSRPERPLSMADRFVRYGAYDESGRLIGKATDLPHEQWWGGRVVPASGIGGVAVVPEYRGKGIGRELLTHLLHRAHDRGAAVANLYCTSAAVYRSLGFEIAGALRHVRLPTAALPVAPREIGGSVRDASGRDWPAVRSVYESVARAGQGLLTRRGGPFADDPADDSLPDGLDGVTLAIDDKGRVDGYASWRRGRGYHDDAVLTVPDCFALTPRAAAALLGVLRTWATVTPTVELRPLPWADAVSAALPVEQFRERRADVWLHRPVDVAAAVAARGWPNADDADVEFRLLDPVLPWNDGAWRLVVKSGEARLERASSSPAAIVHVRGWSLLWCGQSRARQLRQAGWLIGGDDSIHDLLDRTLGSGGPAALLDYF
jgi:predicted acetyltransferase